MEHQPVGALKDKNPEVVQQAGLGCREVLHVDRGKKLALENYKVDSIIRLSFPQRTCKYRKVFMNLSRSATLIVASSSPTLMF